MAVITLPSSGRAASFQLQRSQQALYTVAGVSQITSFPDRRWKMTLNIPTKKTTSTEFRLWSLAMTQLSDMENVFAYTPPWYTGPSTGYAGSDPLVELGSQLGLTLNVDGLPNSTAILLAGDFFSFDVTSPGGSTNRQLNQVTADVTSDGTGDATFSLLIPIRQAPADNAVVNLQAPSAFFRFSKATGGVKQLELLWSEFSLTCEERIFP